MADTKENQVAGPRIGTLITKSTKVVHLKQVAHLLLERTNELSKEIKDNNQALTTALDNFANENKKRKEETDALTQRLQALSAKKADDSLKLDIKEDVASKQEIVLPTPIQDQINQRMRLREERRQRAKENARRRRQGKEADGEEYRPQGEVHPEVLYEMVQSCDSPTPNPGSAFNGPENLPDPGSAFNGSMASGTLPARFSGSCVSTNVFTNDGKKPTNDSDSIHEEAAGAGAPGGPLETAVNRLAGSIKQTQLSDVLTPLIELMDCIDLWMHYEDEQKPFTAKQEIYCAALKTKEIRRVLHALNLPTSKRCR